MPTVHFLLGDYYFVADHKPLVSEKGWVNDARFLEMTLPRHLENSLCSRCKEHRVITSGKGSQFLLCQIGLSDEQWPKYPPQPVGACRKFQPVLASESPESPVSSPSASGSSQSGTVNHGEP